MLKLQYVGHLIQRANSLIKTLMLGKTEGRRIEVFDLWCWGRLLRVPWIEIRSNQTTLKEINPEYSLIGLMLKLKL